MALGSGNDSGPRPWSSASRAGIYSLVPGILVAVVSLWVTGHSLREVMRPSGGGEPGAGIGAAVALTYLTIFGGGIILVGCIFAFVGLSQTPRRWGVIGLALNLGSPLLCFAVYLVLSPFLRPPPPPKTQPTAFLVWCRDNNFGVVLLGGWSSAMPDAHDDFPYRTNWLVRYDGKAPCKTEEEARKFQEAAVAELQHVAQEKGVPLSVEKNDFPAGGMHMGNGGWDKIGETRLTYESGSVRGALSVDVEWQGRADGKPGKEYQIRFWLEEFYRLPEQIRPGSGPH